MINVLMCVHKAGDVLPFALKQFIESPEITRILVADGPSREEAKCGLLVDNPTVKEAVNNFSSDKIYYEYTNNLKNRAWKCNSILKHTTKDCKWILVADADEVYHEDDLKRLVQYLKKTEWDIFKIHLINLYDDFLHEIKINQWTFRIYRYHPDCRCPDNDESHQFVLGPSQKKKPKSERGEELINPEICKFFHLNGVRKGIGNRRTVLNANGTVTWHGSGKKIVTSIEEVTINDLPRSIREYIDRNGVPSL